MHLRDFLDENGLNLAEFGNLVGTTGATICRIVNGQVPRRDLMVRIHQATNGLVTPNDLVGLHGPEQQEVRPCNRSVEDRS